MSARLMSRSGAITAIEIAAGGSVDIGPGTTISRDGDVLWLVADGAQAGGGTCLNGRRVTREALRHLDVITIGRGADLIYLAT